VIEPTSDPLLPMPARIVDKQSYGPSIYSYRLALLEPALRPCFDFLPGQFNMVYAPGVGEVAISISSDPNEEHLEHTIRIVGRTTEVIDRLGVGDVLGLRGPYGNGWPLQQARWKDVLVVTGGLGCAPVSGAIAYMLRRRSSYGRITVLHGVKRPADLAYPERFAHWRSFPDVQVRLTSDEPDRHWRDRTGVVTELFDELELDASRTVVFVCGPDVMLRHTVRFTRERGVPPERVFLSLERNMKCAVGLCGRCQLGPFFLCKDGPILSAARLGRFVGVRGI
jgi:sulfhydrogenase subunit gamma (sulfur reductase)